MTNKNKCVVKQSDVQRVGRDLCFDVDSGSALLQEWSAKELWTMAWSIIWYFVKYRLRSYNPFIKMPSDGWRIVK